MLVLKIVFKMPHIPLLSGAEDGSSLYKEISQDKVPGYDFLVYKLLTDFNPALSCYRNVKYVEYSSVKQS